MRYRWCASERCHLRVTWGARCCWYTDPLMAGDSVALVATTTTGPGILHQLTGVIAKHQGDIASVEIL